MSWNGKFIRTGSKVAELGKWAHMIAPLFDPNRLIQNRRLFDHISEINNLSEKWHRFCFDFDVFAFFGCDEARRIKRAVERDGNFAFFKK